VLNGADAASELLAEVIPEGVRVVRYAVPSRGALTGEPELRAVEVVPTWGGTRVVVEGRGELAAAPRELRIRAIGDVYAENALGALAAAMMAGVPAEQAAEALANAAVPAGRFERVSTGDGPHVVVDYAHTPDALERTVAIARTLCRGSLVVVFGAGGDRDRDKRTPMGASVSAADAVVLTSDNPRSEDPASIAAQIREGIPSRVAVTVQLDRRAAIRAAVLGAGENDVVLVAGKGHETGQTTAGRTVPFDDAAEARAALRERSGASSPTSST
jgi:UDP-N-acetylmuramoyl-L-alanyl-D-glutamate--2,6-diaminopimelate ligase